MMVARARYVFFIPDHAGGPTGGIMNIVRHCALARREGKDAVLATDTGKDRHCRKWFRHEEGCIKWSDRRPDDICVIPDVFTDRVATVSGSCIVYMQSPRWLKTDFDYTREDVQIWTDSPMMLEKCRQLYPGKEIPIVPNIIDNAMFPFIPQSERKRGMIIVFPRKGKEFIKAVFKEYRLMGGRYWKPKVVDRKRFDKMTLIFRKAQAFLASADVEGCALPPQESMAAGVVVVGKNADGANFCMQHGKTAMVSETADGTARCLREMEDGSVRNALAGNAYEFIKRYFPDAEPSGFWRNGAMNPVSLTD